jgi:hypothetical protein
LSKIGRTAGLWLHRRIMETPKILLLKILTLMGLGLGLGIGIALGLYDDSLVSYLVWGTLGAFLFVPTVFVLAALAGSADTDSSEGFGAEIQKLVVGSAEAQHQEDVGFTVRTNLFVSTLIALAIWGLVMGGYHLITGVALGMPIGVALFLTLYVGVGFWRLRALSARMYDD